MTTASFQDGREAPVAAAGDGTQAVARPRRTSLSARVLVAVGPPAVLLVIAVGIWQLVSYVILDPSRRFLLRRCKP